MEGIGERAGSVFLWVRLAVEDFLKGCFESGLGLQKARRYLVDLPPSLDKYYYHILTIRIDSRDTLQAVAAFERVNKCANSLLTGYEFFFDLQLASKDEHPVLDSISDARLSVRLRSISGGLIEVPGDESNSNFFVNSLNQLSTKSPIPLPDSKSYEDSTVWGLLR